jgi:two-component system, OmpR family, sensor histidine kinase CiaH
MPIKKSRNLALFYVLVVYICFQFIWWEVLLVKQTREIHDEKKKLTALSSTDAEILKRDLAGLKRTETVRIYMIVGEGTVFLILITLGIIRVLKTYKRETELAQQQKNFLLSITHELKSPIASAKLQLQTLQKHELDAETRARLITNAVSDTERLQALVENILMSASLDIKDDLLRKQDLNLSELAENTIQFNVPETIKAKLDLEVQKDVFLNADPIAFPSIILNLLENADKYGGDTRIKFELKKSGNTVVLIVSDNGPGIPDKEKEKIFEKFYRSGEEETRKAKGTGLGLFIVKRLTEQHNGKVSVKNNSPSGTTFLLEFNA